MAVAEISIAHIGTVGTSLRDYVARALSVVEESAFKIDDRRDKLGTPEQKVRAVLDQLQDD